MKNRAVTNKLLCSTRLLVSGQCSRTEQLEAQRWITGANPPDRHAEADSQVGVVLYAGEGQRAASARREKVWGLRR